MFSFLWYNEFKSFKMTNKQKAKILLFDIEIAPAHGWFWQMYDTNIIEVSEHSYMLSFSYKWLGESKVYTYKLPDFSGYIKNPKDDKKLLIELSKLISEADIVIAHNGDKFDITFTNTRLVANGLKPMALPKTIDTLKVARTKFRFLSNRLDDLGNFLGVGRKLPHTGKHLWFGCMNNDSTSWKLMQKYNEQDVRLLEAVYYKLRPWMTNHPNLNVINGTLQSCRNCGSKHLQKRGVIPTTTGTKQRYQCQDCGSWSTGKSETVKDLVIR